VEDAVLPGPGRVGLCGARELDEARRRAQLQPQLAFGDRDPLLDLVRPGPDGLPVDLAPSDYGAFQAPSQVHGSYGSACLAGELFVNGMSFSDMEQSRQKLAKVVEELRILELEPAS
jgi:hypothetical protein